MTLVISSNDPSIDIGATGSDEISQNVRTIIRTIQGTVPLDRDFGLAADLVDLPLPLAKAKLAAAIVKAVERYEPRVQVLRVEVEPDTDAAMSGSLHTTVTVNIIKEA